MIIRMRTKSFSFLEDVVQLIKGLGFDVQISNQKNKFIVAVLGTGADEIGSEVLDRLSRLGMEGYERGSRFFESHYKEFLEEQLFFQQFDTRPKLASV
jgi:hypothetical protein